MEASKPSPLALILLALNQNLKTNSLDYAYICFGTLIGAALGLLMTLVVMSTLILISISGPFNLYYGLLTASLGFMMIFKIYRKNKIVELDGADATGTKMSKSSIQRLDMLPSNTQLGESQTSGGLAAGILHEPMALNDSVMLSS